MDQPLTTVGVALYNHERYIVECLQSIIEQTYQPIELIVIDDGSTDDSYAVAKKYLESQQANKNYTIRSRPNQGICHTLNEIANAATGDYISYIGSDDYWMNDKIADQAHYLSTHPEVALVHSCSIRVDENGTEIGKLNYPNKLKEGRLFEALVTNKAKINTTSHLYRTSVFDKIGHYDPRFKFEDTDFWLRLSKEHQVGFINKEHCAYRWHGENYSKTENQLQFYADELIAIYRKNVSDTKLLKRVLRKIHARSFKMALRSGKYTRAVQELKKFWFPQLH